MPRLDTHTLDRALATLQEAVDARKTDPTNGFVRDACIQRFEYSYELSHKMLRRVLLCYEPSPDIVDGLTFPALVRLGFKRGYLTSSWDIWRRFREARNITSHTYDENKAQLVLELLDDFLAEARQLSVAVQQRISGHEGPDD